MVKMYDECYRLLCEAELSMSGGDVIRICELPEAFLRYDYDEGHPFYPMPHGIPVNIFGDTGNCCVAKSGNRIQIAFV